VEKQSHVALPAEPGGKTQRAEIDEGLRLGGAADPPAARRGPGICLFDKAGHICIQRMETPGKISRLADGVLDKAVPKSTASAGEDHDGRAPLQEMAIWLPFGDSEGPEAASCEFGAYGFKPLRHGNTPVKRVLSAAQEVNQCTNSNLLNRTFRIDRFSRTALGSTLGRNQKMQLGINRRLR
jgi:hypothetical protein